MTASRPSRRFLLWCAGGLLVVACDLGRTCDAARREAAARECQAGMGCLNAQFMAAVDEKCPTGPSCRLSLEEALGDLEKVYFVERLAADLEQCKTIPVSTEIGRSYSPLCQYLLLQRNGRITSYLRGYCIDIKVSGDRLGFNPEAIGRVSAMDAGSPVVVRRTREGGPSERATTLYYVDPPKEALMRIVSEPCIGTP